MRREVAAVAIYDRAVVVAVGVIAVGRVLVLLVSKDRLGVRVMPVETRFDVILVVGVVGMSSGVVPASRTDTCGGSFFRKGLSISEMEQVEVEFLVGLFCDGTHLLFLLLVGTEVRKTSVAKVQPNE